MQYSYLSRSVSVVNLSPKFSWQLFFTPLFPTVDMIDVHSINVSYLLSYIDHVYIQVDPNRKRNLKDAEAVLAEEKRKLAEEAEKREQERLEMERIRQEEEEAKKNQPRDDDIVTDAWKAFHAAVAEFEEDYFTTDDVWDRNEARQYCWSLFDGAKKTSNDYYTRREEIEQIVTEGTREV